MTAEPARPASRRPFLDWKAWVGFLLSAGLLWYAFRDVHAGEVWRELRSADPFLLAATALLVTLPFPLRAIRWRHLLRPVHPGSRFRPRFAATCIGFMANNLLPARVGEFARAFALSRLEPAVRLPASFGSLVIERIFDGLTVVALLVIALTWPGFPDVSGRDFGTAALWMGAVFLLGFVVLLVMVARPVASVRFLEGTAVRLLPRGIRRPVVDALEAFLEGMAAIRDWRLVVRVAGWSLVLWLAVGVGTWIGFRAFGIEAPLIAAVFLQSIISLAVALPSAPGFFGVFEAAARIGLVDVWGVESTRAVSFALGLHLAGFIPVTVMGLYYLWRLGLSWRDVERSEEMVESAVEADPPEGEKVARSGNRGAGEARP